MELQRLRTSVCIGVIDSYSFSSLRRYGDWYSVRTLFSLRILIPFCGNAHRHCDTFTRREMRCCTIDVGSHTSCIWDGVHDGTSASGQHTPVLRQTFFFWIPLAFPLSSLFILASEFLDLFFGFCILLAWSHYTRVTASRLRRGRTSLFYSSFSSLFNVVTMGCFYTGVGLRRRSGSDAYLFRLPNMGVPSRWVRHCVSARTI
jgi:hypothetical protein